MDNGNSGELSLGDLFRAAGLAPEGVQVIRHTLKPDGLKTRADAMGPNLLPYAHPQQQAAGGASQVLAELPGHYGTTRPIHYRA